ncbi:MAG TPA: GNAT family N-acetyltransferase [Pyrinomonadaceae bacterium]|jgi:predicted acetyltransferase
MNFEGIKLIEPAAALKAAFLDMAEEFGAGSDDHYKFAREDFEGFLERLSNFARSTGLPPNRVPQNTFWLVGDGKILGESNLRHYLNAELETEGGHIGYAVRPSARRRGYGTLILRLTLEKAKNLGLKRVLVTCDTDNVGSSKIIEKNGGELCGQDLSNRTGKPISRYRIEIL